MKTWNTLKMIELFQPLRKELNFKINFCSGNEWGDYNSDVIELSFKNVHDFLHVIGFRTGKTISNPEKCLIEYIELTDGKDSEGGLNSENEKIIELYHKIKKLLEKNGYMVVNRLKDYF